MNDAPPSLDALRREIDTIDDALHDLLMQRAALVTDIGALKNSEQAAVFRPAREAMLLRRLLARHDSNLPAIAVARIWSEIISASSNLQGGLTVAYCPIGDVVTADRMVHGRFGAGVPVVSASTPGQVIMAVTSGEASVGVVPVPRQDDTTPWWTLMYGRTGPTEVQVIAAVPFMVEDDNEETGGLVIALGAAEPSGDDRSLIVFECSEPFSRDRIRDVLGENGIEAVRTVSYDDPARPDAHLHLADVVGHVPLDDPRLDRVRLALPARAAWQIGVYAAPIDLRG